MSHNRIMRLLRLKHHISAAELARAAKVSPQRVFQIELCEHGSTEYQRELIYEAFSIIALENSNTALRHDLRRLEYSLLDFTEEDSIK